jgi:nicotinate dehydrogenase subunit A
MVGGTCRGAAVFSLYFQRRPGGSYRPDLASVRKLWMVGGTCRGAAVFSLYFQRGGGLHGPRFGCGLGQCGACTVHVDGEAVRSCVTPLSSLSAQQRIVTLEGLGSPQNLHPVQQAFIDEQAVQCGYCINGMIMQSAAFLAKNRNPTEDAIRGQLANNLCRCGTHLRIIRAVQRAAKA